MSKKKQAKMASKKSASKTVAKVKTKAAPKALKKAPVAAKAKGKPAKTVAPKATSAKAAKAAPAAKVKLAAVAKPAKLQKPAKPAKAAAAPVAPPLKGKPGRPAKAGSEKGAIPVSASVPAKAARGKKAGLTSRAYDSDACRETQCDTHATTVGYCRLHYIKNWKKIKRKELILKEKKLNQYIEELVAKYPEKYIEAIRQDLADEKSFSKVIYDLELDENVEDIEVEGENDEDIIEGIKRGGFDEGDPEF